MAPPNKSAKNHHGTIKIGIKLYRYPARRLHVLERSYLITNRIKQRVTTGAAVAPKEKQRFSGKESTQAHLKTLITTEQLLLN